MITLFCFFKHVSKQRDFEIEAFQTPQEPICNRDIPRRALRLGRAWLWFELRERVQQMVEMLLRICRYFICVLGNLCQSEFTFLQTPTNNAQNAHEKRALECKDKMLHLGLLNAFGNFNFAFTIEQWHRTDLLKIDKHRLVGLLFIARFWR